VGLAVTWSTQFAAWAMAWVISRRYYRQLPPTVIASHGHSQRGL